MLHIAQLQRDSMALHEIQDTAREFMLAVQIVSRPPDFFETKLSLFEPGPGCAASRARAERPL